MKREFKERWHRKPTSVETMWIGALSGGLAAAVTNPFDVVTTRLMVQVRLMRPDADGRLRPAPVDVPFELALCT